MLLVGHCDLPSASAAQHLRDRLQDESIDPSGKPYNNKPDRLRSAERLWLGLATAHSYSAALNCSGRPSPSIVDASQGVAILAIFVAIVFQYVMRCSVPDARGSGPPLLVTVGVGGWLPVFFQPVLGQARRKS